MLILLIVIAVIAAAFLIPRIITAKYTGSTIRIFNKTLSGVGVAYVGKIVSEREKKNIIKYPYVNYVFLCKPGKDAKEEYYTYSHAQKRLYYLEDVHPGMEKYNTEESSVFHEVILTPIDKKVLNFVFRQY